MGHWDIDRWAERERLREAYWEKYDRMSRIMSLFAVGMGILSVVLTLAMQR